MKILFILSAIPELSAENAEKWKIRFPLMAPSSTLLILAELARAKNYTVELLDTRLFMRLDKLSENSGWTLDLPAIEKEILEKKPNLVGISFMSSSAPDAYRIAAICRKNNIKIIAGGLHAKVAESELIEQNVFDFIYQGEAETAFAGFLENLENDLLEKHSERAQVINAPTLKLKEMNAVPPIPDFSYYAGAMRQYAENRTVYVELSRGCVKNCTFCEVAKTGAAFKPFRPIPLENIYKTIKAAVSEYNADYILISDSIATLHKKNFLEFMRFAQRNFPAATVQFNSTVDHFDVEIAEAIKDMRCNVWFGFESGSQRILDFIEKGTTVGQASEAARICREYKIPGGFNILIGVPGERREDYELTEEFFAENENAFPNPNILNPLPGTEMFRYCQANDLLRYKNDYSIWNAEKIRKKDFAGPVKSVNYKMVIEFYEKFTKMQNEPKRSLKKEIDIFPIQKFEKFAPEDF